MKFVDGENRTIRGQSLAKAESLILREGTHYKRDAFSVDTGDFPIQAVHCRWTRTPTRTSESAILLLHISDMGSGSMRLLSASRYISGSLKTGLEIADCP